MKKSKFLAAAMASIALTGALGSCSFSPGENVEPDVYGPPESYEEPVVDQESDEEYDPAENIEPDVYGPSEAFDSSDGN